MTPPSKPSRFEATAAALGYLFQFRHALARGLEALGAGSYEWTIAIESADDVVLTDDDSRELRQLKQVGRQMTDGSTDLWKTIRIWSEGISDGTLDPRSCRFYLVTTADLGNTAAVSQLSQPPELRDIAAADSALTKVCRDSSSQANQKAYKAFTRLSDTQRRQLIERVQILPRSDNVTDLAGAIQRFLRIGTHREHHAAMLERLEGWWFSKCIANLTEPAQVISAEQLDGYVSGLRDQFSPNNLPIDFDIVTGPEPDTREFHDRTFVRQAQLAGIGKRRVQMAVRDYLRAFAQRSRWARLNLVTTHEIEAYERRLRDEWEIAFEQLQDELPPDAAESAKRQMAQEIYRWAESSDLSPIRSQCTEPFVKRGSLHMLADSLHVGWHPDFLESLREILEPVT